MKTLHRNKKYDENAAFKIKPESILRAASLDDLLDYKRKHPIAHYEKIPLQTRKSPSTEPAKRLDL